jgi:hypothetical protein
MHCRRTLAHHPACNNISTVDDRPACSANHTLPHYTHNCSSTSSHPPYQAGTCQQCKCGSASLPPPAPPHCTRSGGDAHSALPGPAVHTIGHMPLSIACWEDMQPQLSEKCNASTMRAACQMQNRRINMNMQYAQKRNQLQGQTSWN